MRLIPIARSKNSYYKLEFDLYSNTTNLLFFLILFLLPSLVFARAEIDISEFESDGEFWPILVTLGLFGAMVCHEHRRLVLEFSENVNNVLKWIFRISLFFIVIPILGNLVGFYFNDQLGTKLIGFWGVLKAAQGIYISGVAAGIRR